MKKHRNGGRRSKSGHERRKIRVSPFPRVSLGFPPPGSRRLTMLSLGNIRHLLFALKSNYAVSHTFHIWLASCKTGTQTHFFNWSKSAKWAFSFCHAFFGALPAGRRLFQDQTRLSSTSCSYQPGPFRQSCLGRVSLKTTPRPCSAEFNLASGTANPATPG